tara:strand:- start:324 stop:1022 length:699 start_codon:yes stop_codon:yes gene_type:complete
MLGLSTGITNTSYQWQPTSVGADLKLWFRNNVGVAVGQWDDSSGNANHAVQDTSGNQGSLSGDGGIDFEGGSSHHYDLGEDVVVSADEAFMIFLVCTVESYDTQNSILGTGDANVFLELQTNRKIRFKTSDGTDSIEYPADTLPGDRTKMILGIKRDSGSTGNVHLYKNGSLVTPSSQQANRGAITFDQLASRNDDRYFDGKILELLCYDTTDLTANEIVKINNYLLNKHNI